MLQCINPIPKVKKIYCYLSQDCIVLSTTVLKKKRPATGRLRFIEVKGRRADAETVTVTRNEILCSLNKPDDFILAVVEFRDDDTHRVHYVRRPFRREPDFAAASVNYKMKDLLAKAEEPR